jgi:hypothetical protein
MLDNRMKIKTKKSNEKRMMASLFSWLKTLPYIGERWLA